MAKIRFESECDCPAEFEYCEDKLENCVCAILKPAKPYWTGGFATNTVVYKPKSCRASIHACICPYGGYDMCMSSEHYCSCIQFSIRTGKYFCEPQTCRARTKIKHGCLCLLDPLICSVYQSNDWGHGCNCAHYYGLCRVHTYIPDVLNELWIIIIEYKSYIQWFPREMLDELYLCLFHHKKSNQYY